MIEGWREKEEKVMSKSETKIKRKFNKLLDKVSKSETLKAIPVFSNCLAVINDAKTISNYLYLKKLSAFMDGFKKRNPEERDIAEARELYARDQERFETTLLFFIEKAENDEKTHLLGYITAELMSGRIKDDEFVFLMNVVNSIQMLFLKQFSEDYLDEIKIKKDSLHLILSLHGLVCYKGVNLRLVTILLNEILH